MKVFERNTTVSQNVMQILEEHHAPISIIQVMKKLRENDLSPNKSTIYRIFDKLKEKKVVSEMVLKNGITYYEIKSNHHHHHFLCESCDTVYCLATCHSDTLTFDIKKLVPNKNFNVNYHEFTLYGQCDLCQKS